MTILDKINSPQDVKELTVEEMETLASEIRNGILCTISFFCFVKVMENKTGTSAFFSIAMKVEVWLCICLHGKDAAKMF